MPKKSALVSILIILICLVAAGCGLLPAQNRTPDSNPPVDPNPSVSEIEATLYFGDQNAEYLQREVRTVKKGSEPVEFLLITELLKGPQESGMIKTLPPEAKLLDVRVAEGTAFINFSRELQTRHWGGSAGELLTVYSVVNTITELPTVQRVQFLIEGDKMESLAGHMDTQEPISRDEGYIK
jgi:germination protein M